MLIGVSSSIVRVDCIGFISKAGDTDRSQIFRYQWLTTIQVGQNTWNGCTRLKYDIRISRNLEQLELLKPPQHYRAAAVQ